MENNTEPIHINKPTVLVIFGGTGDLAKTKLFPALFDLYIHNKLPDRFGVIGLSRREITDEEYRVFVRESISSKVHNHDEKIVQDFCSCVRYVAGNFNEPDTYERVKKATIRFDESIGQCTNKLFYLAVPPQYYEVIFEELHASNAMALCDGHDSWARLLVEKPFGHNLATAQVLEKKLCSLFADKQVYRIDHYLAKDAIENIVALRFMNSIMADSWNGKAIESISIRLLETKDVSTRGSFFDGVGILRDVGQNHILQMFALLTMPEGNIHDFTSIRSSRATALRQIESQTPDYLIRGQYEGFADIQGVKNESDTETYFKLSFTMQDEVWHGTRVTLESGKALNQDLIEAIITFRPQGLCYCSAEAEPHEHRNVLKVRFAPEQHIGISMWMKQPGFAFTLRKQELVLVESLGEESDSPEAYERVLFDCIAGDQTRFVSGAEVESSWRFITPILERFKDLPLHTYKKDSAGPEVL